jgi:hypothetical protein
MLSEAHVRTLIIAAFVVVTAACGDAGSLADVEVKTVSLSNLDWSTVDAVVGLTESTGVLTVVDTSGNAHTTNVDISGPAIGFLFDISGGTANGPNDAIIKNSGQLTLPKGKQLKGSDLVGGYAGNETAAALVIGGESHDLTNGAGVRLEGGALNFGMGLLIAFEWLSITAK